MKKYLLFLIILLFTSCDQDVAKISESMKSKNSPSPPPITTVTVSADVVRVSFEQGQFNQTQLVDALKDDPSHYLLDLNFKDSSNNVIDLNTLTPGEHIVTATYNYNNGRGGVPSTSRTKTININVTPLTFSFEQGQFNRTQLLLRHHSICA